MSGETGPSWARVASPLILGVNVCLLLEPTVYIVRQAKQRKGQATLNWRLYLSATIPDTRSVIRWTSHKTVSRMG